MKRAGDLLLPTFMAETFPKFLKIQHSWKWHQIWFFCWLCSNWPMVQTWICCKHFDCSDEVFFLLPVARTGSATNKLVAFHFKIDTNQKNFFVLLKLTFVKIHISQSNETTKQQLHSKTKASFGVIVDFCNENGSDYIMALSSLKAICFLSQLGKSVLSSSNSTHEKFYIRPNA